jgi:hypothetical protein
MWKKSLLTLEKKLREISEEEKEKAREGVKWGKKLLFQWTCCLLSTEAFANRDTESFKPP